MTDTDENGHAGMELTGYVARLRACVGHDLLLSPSAAACIRDEEGRILLLRRSDGDNLWGFPGGAMEPGERIADTVVREVREETRLEIEPTAIIGVYSAPEYAFAYPNGDRVQPVTTFFECRVVGGRLRPDMKESLAAHYFGPEDELPPMHPCCVAKANDAFAFHGQAFFR
jgi:8-oxo-dGTP pyrophosphatase MutT (NUDIX family)